MKLKSLLWLALVVALGVVIWAGVHRKPFSKQAPASHEHAGPPARENGSVDAHKSSSTIPSTIPAPTREDDSPASPNIQIIVNAQNDYMKRIAAVETLSATFTPEDERALRGFLLRPDAADSKQGTQMFKNRLLNTLCTLNPPPPWLGNTLVQMYRDRSQHAVIRDYAVQHMAEYFQQLKSITALSQGNNQAVGAPLPDDAFVMRDMLWEALSETDSSIAGTALLALSRLSESYPEFDRDRIAQEAIRLGKNEGTGELSRITAFQVCGELGVKGITSQLLRTASSEQTIPLRISAVAALGAVGDSDSRRTLTDLLNGTEPRLKLPAKLALTRIDQREQRVRSGKN
jgi:hypothetical protein